MAQRPTFYVTTPIYYANAKPHLGTLYSTLLADVIARLERARGKEVYFLTGLDEHGQKIAEAATAAGMEPKQFVDQMVAPFKDCFRLFEIDYSRFMRTTDTDHVRAVQEWLTVLIKKGDIYKARYEGWYCTSCETYVTEKDIEQSGSAEAPSCPSCSRQTQWMSEESYFFKLSAYQEQLLAWYAEHPEWVTPAERLNEVIAFVKSGLKDLSISRSTISWGVPFPGDTAHVTYVWADALNNYITAVGYGDSARAAEFARWWPADVQVMGKDILRFHAVFWPAFLMASGLPLPRRLLVHGWLKVGEHKMSKSRGNAIDPLDLQKKYGADPVRFYLVRHTAITQDSPVSLEDFEEKVNADLAHNLGNLVSRVFALAAKHNLHLLQRPATLSQATRDIEAAAQVMFKEYNAAMDDYFMHRAYGAVMHYAHTINAYVHAQEPWRLAKTNPALCAEVLWASCAGLHVIAQLLAPVMPERMATLMKGLGVVPSHENYVAGLVDKAWALSYTITPLPPLFSAIQPSTSVSMSTPEQKVEAPAQSYLTFDDFMKVQLHVGTIQTVDEVAKSDKLYRLSVSFGPLGNRQILAGIKQKASPEQLLGKQAIFVLNLPPRVMLGMTSEGMLLVAADERGGVAPTTVAHPVPDGTRVG